MLSDRYSYDYNVLPGSAAYAPDGRSGVLIRDGGTPLALVDGHGTWLDWLD